MIYYNKSSYLEPSSWVVGILKDSSILVSAALCRGPSIVHSAGWALYAGPCGLVVLLPYQAVRFHLDGRNSSEFEEIPGNSSSNWVETVSALPFYTLSTTLSPFSALISTATSLCLSGYTSAVTNWPSSHASHLHSIQCLYFISFQHFHCNWHFNVFWHSCFNCYFSSLQYLLSSLFHTFIPFNFICVNTIIRLQFWNGGELAFLLILTSHYTAEGHITDIKLINDGHLRC